jgi:hypothetical protein
MRYYQEGNARIRWHDPSDKGGSVAYHNARLQDEVATPFGASNLDLIRDLFVLKSCMCSGPTVNYSGS